MSIDFINLSARGSADGQSVGGGPPRPCRGVEFPGRGRADRGPERPGLPRLSRNSSTSTSMMPRRRLIRGRGCRPPVHPIPRQERDRALASTTSPSSVAGDRKGAHEHRASAPIADRRRAHESGRSSQRLVHRCRRTRRARNFTLKGDAALALSRANLCRLVVATVALEILGGGKAIEAFRSCGCRVQVEHSLANREETGIGFARGF